MARLNERTMAEVYRIYVTDALRVVAENTAKFVGGCSIERRYIDVVKPKKQDNRTCEEITADIVERCGLVVKHESS